MNDMIQERVSAKEAALHATYDERLRNYDERYVYRLSVLFAEASHTQGFRRHQGEGLAASSHARPLSTPRTSYDCRHQSSSLTGPLAAARCGPIPRLHRRADYTDQG